MSDNHDGLTPQERGEGLNRATFAHDQCLACINEIYDRMPHALLYAVRPDGPMKLDGAVIPEMKRGEWEIIRKLAQLGWSHFSMELLTEEAAQ